MHTRCKSIDYTRDTCTSAERLLDLDSCLMFMASCFKGRLVCLNSKHNPCFLVCGPEDMHEVTKKTASEISYASVMALKLTHQTRRDTV